LSVVKKNDTREPYDREKIIAGLRKACYKRPVPNNGILEIVESTEEEIFRKFDKEVPTTFIGDLLSAHLRQVDKIAYVRFASVYREFADVGDLINEATDVKDVPDVGPEQRELF
jgi:transcriptional repressor NrdR